MTDRTLVLHIAIPGVNIDDWDDLVSYARMDTDDVEPTAADMGEVFTMEAIRSEVGITIVTLPGEKNMNDDFSVHSFDGQVIGASLAIPDKWGRLVATEADALAEENNDGPS